MPTVACPPLLPPVPDWHPQPWAVTAWGGQMIDADFGPTFLFDGRMRPEGLLGVGLQKRIMRAGPLAIELEADLFSHIARAATRWRVTTKASPMPISHHKALARGFWGSEHACGSSLG